MSYTITTLLENASTSDRLISEHGLSLHITDGAHALLFDTGASSAFLDNAAMLGINLDAVDTLVFSHGHYDHTGGTKALLDRHRAPKEVYVGENFFDPRYHREGGIMRPIGALFTEQELYEKKTPCFILEKGVRKLFEGIYLVSGFSSTNDIEKPSPSMIRLQAGQYQTDSFCDEIAIVLDTDDGLALLSGCSHNGILSICDHIEQLFGRPVRTFIGGTHLMTADAARIEQTLHRLLTSGLRRLGACHCNGAAAAAVFSAGFEGFFCNNGGTVITL